MVGREHLLVALASQGESTLVAVIPGAGPTLSALLSQQSPEGQDHADAQALAAVGIDLDAIRASVAETIGPDAWAEGAPGRRRPSGLIARLLPDHRPFTPGARKALELALRETIAERSREITATHLLRGLLRDPGPHVMAILDPDLVAEFPPASTGRRRELVHERLRGSPDPQRSTASHESPWPTQVTPAGCSGDCDR